jgi:hypothetical protein
MFTDEQRIAEVARVAQDWCDYDTTGLHAILHAATEPWHAAKRLADIRVICEDYDADRDDPAMAAVREVLYDRHIVVNWDGLNWSATVRNPAGQQIDYRYLPGETPEDHRQAEQAARQKFNVSDYDRIEVRVS